MIIATTGQKGGSGKTTVALNIADELHRRGHKTLLIDADPQASAITAAGWRPEDMDGPDIVSNPAILQGTWKAARKELADLLDEYTHILIDPPPQDLAPQRVVLANAHLAVLPCGPTGFDLWSIQDTLELVREYRNARDELKAKILLNQVRANTRLSREAREVIEDADLPVFDTHFSMLVDFAESPSSGIGVTRYAPDGKAALQVRRLVDEILSR
jgi:chromosome partitioning protein